MDFLQEYQQELFQLKEEFERYKTRAQSVLKNRGNKVRILDVITTELSLFLVCTQRTCPSSSIIEYRSVMILYIFIQESDVTNKEIKELQQRNNELQQLVDSLKNECEELDEKNIIQTRKLREEMRSLHDKHKQQVASLDTSHKVGSCNLRCGCISVCLYLPWKLHILITWTRCRLCNAIITLHSTFLDTLLPSANNFFSHVGLLSTY